MEKNFELTVFLRNGAVGRKWLLTRSEARDAEVRDGAFVVTYRNEEGKERADIYPLDLVSRIQVWELD